MTKRKGRKGRSVTTSKGVVRASNAGYTELVASIGDLLKEARRSVVRSANAVLTATYWEIGRRIVEYEQHGEVRAEYGKRLLTRLGKDLSQRYGRGFSWRNLYQMRSFYLGWRILQTLSGKFEARVILPTPSGKGAVERPRTATCKSKAGGRARTKDVGPHGKILQTLSAESPETSPKAPWSALTGMDLAVAFPLSWSHYVHLMAVASPEARAFYEQEAIRGGWSVRQLDRQIGTQFCERALQSKRPAALLARGRLPQAQDKVSVEEEIRDPYVLEFLNLKDEYGESDLEEALIRHLEAFLLELGAGFTFVARQKRIRVGDSWYRMDLLLYHRGLRCLVVIDLKTGAFTHADAGQMNLYLNYAREHLTLPGEADPVGIILCSRKDDAVVKYATGGIMARVFASEYLTKLPDVETLRLEIVKTRRALQARRTEGEGD